MCIAYTRCSRKVLGVGKGELCLFQIFKMAIGKYDSRTFRIIDGKRSEKMERIRLYCLVASIKRQIRVCMRVQTYVCTYLLIDEMSTLVEISEAASSGNRP